MDMEEGIHADIQEGIPLSKIMNIFMCAPIHVCTYTYVIAMKRPRARSATLVRGRFITGIFEVCVDTEES